MKIEVKELDQLKREISVEIPPEMKADCDEKDSEEGPRNVRERR